MYIVAEARLPFLPGAVPKPKKGAKKVRNEPTTTVCARMQLHLQRVERASRRPQAVFVARVGKRAGAPLKPLRVWEGCRHRPILWLARLLLTRWFVPIAVAGRPARGRL